MAPNERILPLRCPVRGCHQASSPVPNHILACFGTQGRRTTRHTRVVHSLASAIRTRGGSRLAVQREPLASQTLLDFANEQNRPSQTILQGCGLTSFDLTAAAANKILCADVTIASPVLLTRSISEADTPINSAHQAKITHYGEALSGDCITPEG